SVRPHRRPGLPYRLAQHPPGPAIRRLSGLWHRPLVRHAGVHQHRRQHGAAADQGADPALDELRRQQPDLHPGVPGAAAPRRHRAAAGHGQRPARGKEADMSQATRPLMIVAGGTGGHVFPGLAVAEELRRRGVPVVWLGTRHGLEARLVPAAGIPIAWLTVRGLRRRGLRGWLAAPWMVARSTLQALRIMRRHRPRAVLGMGGYVSGPGVLAARLLGIPLLIHEQNAIPGFTNRKLAPLASCIMTGFAGVFEQYAKAVHTGNPVRAEIARLAADTTIQRAAEGRRLRLLVLGGSQGAAAINQVVPAALLGLEPRLRPEVWHQTGAADVDAT